MFVGLFDEFERPGSAERSEEAVEIAVEDCDGIAFSREESAAVPVELAWLLSLP